ncbi:MAG: hypothetical protein K8W52_37270 [Deltaproteobacteria bacterium]|nr:hypothetical protein [Deltaproteobacteria bacterium]
MRGSVVRSIGVVSVVAGLASMAHARPAAKVPASVLATVERGPASARDGLIAYANAIKPGTGIALTDPVVSSLFARAVGLATIDGLDAAQPEFLVWVDDGTVRGAAVVGAIADDAVLSKEAAGLAIARDHGRAIVGAKPVVDQIGAWALAALRQPEQGRPSATIYVGNGLARYRAELATLRSKLTVGSVFGGGASAGMQGAMAGLASTIFDGTLALAGDTERVILTFDADPTVAGIDVALVPRAGSKLAKFVAAQGANDFALIDKLPAGAGAVVAAGAFHAGPYRNAVGVAMAALYAGGDASVMVAPTLELMQATTGEFAATTRMSAGGMQNVQLMSIASPAAAARAHARLMTAIANPISMTVIGLKATLHASAQPLVYDGLAIGSFETAIDQTTLTAVQKAAMSKTMPGGRAVTYMGLVDRLAITVSGSDGEAATRAVIDSARGHAAALVLGADLQPLVDAARARRDSAIMILDMNLMRGIAAPPGTALPVLTMMMSAGFADHRAHLRMTMPVATFRSAAGLP